MFVHTKEPTHGSTDSVNTHMECLVSDHFTADIINILHSFVKHLKVLLNIPCCLGETKVVNSMTDHRLDRNISNEVMESIPGIDRCG